MSLSKNSIIKILKEYTKKNKEILSTKVDKEIGKSLSSNDFTNEYKDKLDNLNELPTSDDTMFKSEYASEINKGNVKNADVADKITLLENNSEPNVYYGHNSEGITGLYPFPIGTQDESKLITKEYLNITEGWEKVVAESVSPLNNKVIVSVMKNISNQTDIDITIKDFNLENDLSINHTDDVLVTTDGISIKKSYTENAITNDDGLSEIDISKYSNILNIEIEG